MRLCVFENRRWAEALPGIFHRQGGGGSFVTSRGNSHEMRASTHEMRQAARPNPSSRDELRRARPKPRLDLGDLGAAHGNAMRRRAVEFDHRAVPLLAHESDVRDRHDMAAVHPDEQAGIELRFGLRDRPRAHPLAGAVMHPGIMGVGPDAAHIGGIDEMRAVGALDRKPGRRRRRAAAGRGRRAAPTSAAGSSAAAPASGGRRGEGRFRDRIGRDGDAAVCRRGSGTSDSRKPAAITKHSTATTTERICGDAASPPANW